ncbi:ANTAR domain-containing response regulator [Rhodopirellula baltica]
MNDDIGRSRTIYLAHGDECARRVISTMLEALGHTVPVVTESGKCLIEHSVHRPPDIIVAAPRLSDMDGIEALIRIGERRPVPAIIVARSDDLDKVERALEDHVMAYLVEPLTTESLQPAIFLAERRFKHFEDLRRQVTELEEKLEHRRIIERAKGIVMQARDLGESDAHRLLQNTATRSRQKLIDLAKHVCATGDLFSEVPKPKR